MRVLTTGDITLTNHRGSGMKALNCFNAPHRANSNFSFRKSATHSRVVSENGCDEDFTHNCPKYVQSCVLCIYRIYLYRLSLLKC